MPLTDQDVAALKADRDAARQGFADKLVDSLTNDQANWTANRIFDQQQLWHAPSGLKFQYPLDWVTVVLVDGTEIRLPSYNYYEAICTLVDEIIARNATTQLEGTE